jgi:predicted enzyme related to lactoylglutathione lyase
MTTYRPGQFVWRDLFTTDVAASQRFYAEVFGWKLDTVSYPGGDDHYAMLQVGEQTIGGLMKVPMPGMPPFWTPYVSVDDVDAAAARVLAAGGKVMHGPEDVPNVGRYVLVRDPQGAAIHAWRHIEGDGERREKPGVGEFCWEHLNTTDPAKAAAFYAAVFGWTIEPSVLDARIVEYAAGSVQVASSMQAPPEVPAHWLSYVVVDTLAATFARVKQHGGSVMTEAIPVTGLGTLAVIQDNVGAVIGLFEAS